jgi:hypothetical protein
MKLMKKTSVALAIGALGLLMTSSVSLARDAMTLHLEVISDEDSDNNVKMAMPMDLIAAMASSLNTDESVTAELFDEFSDEGFDLRKFWQQVKDGDINEFFNMEVEDATIRAWREDGMFRLTVDASEGGADVAGRDRAHVVITIPENLMDILVEQDGQMAPEDMVAELRAMGPMTLVEVDTDKEQVRIWLE